MEAMPSLVDNLPSLRWGPTCASNLIPKHIDGEKPRSLRPHPVYMQPGLICTTVRNFASAGPKRIRRYMNGAVNVDVASKQVNLA